MYIFWKRLDIKLDKLFLVYSKCYYSISVRLAVILTVEKQTSECHLSKETNTMHIIQMAQEQHAIYFGYAFFRRFRLILQNIGPI